MPAAPALADAPLLRALRGEPVERTPVWFMRQAGRSLPEYRELRKQGGLLELCRSPELCAEATLQPVRRHGVDAAVFYSDIVLPLAAMGVGVEIKPGVGPVVAEPIRTARDLERLRPYEPGTDSPYVGESVALLVRELGPVPLVGFAGAPFTLASYLVEGGPSKDKALTKAMMLAEPVLWAALLERLADIAVASLRAQVAAGASAVQLFDSWIGALSVTDFELRVLPAVRRIFAGLEDLDVPRIYFGVDTPHLLEAMARSGADALGLDWRLPLAEGARRAGGLPVQGNLDPAACLAPWEVVAREAEAVLAQAPERGYVFNLGHGVLPETDPDVLTRLVELVHGFER